MSTISVLRTVKAESDLEEESHGRSGCRPTSLLAFLQVENRKLQHTVAQLRRDTKALQEALQKTESARFMQSRN